MKERWILKSFNEISQEYYLEMISTLRKDIVDKFNQIIDLEANLHNEGVTLKIIHTIGVEPVHVYFGWSYWSDGQFFTSPHGVFFNLRLEPTSGEN